MVDYTRHMKIFDEEIIKDKNIVVIGAGAVGSKIILELAKLNVKNVHIVDFDIVEQHNISNQAYALHHIGMKKTDAIKELVYTYTKNTYITHDIKISSIEEIPIEPTIIFMCVDSMEARKDISSSLEMNLTSELLIDTRMGLDFMYIYNINPNDENEIEFYKTTLTEEDDPTIEDSYCGSRTVVGSTTNILSGVAIWQFLKWFNATYKIDNHEDAKSRSNKLPNEILLSMRPDYLNAHFIEKEVII